MSHKAGLELVLEAFEEYWRKVPHIKRIVMRVVPDEATRLAQLKNGEVDIAYLMVGAIGEEVKRDPRLRLIPSGGNRYSGSACTIKPIRSPLGMM